MEISFDIFLSFFYWFHCKTYNELKYSLFILIGICIYNCNITILVKARFYLYY